MEKSSIESVDKKYQYNFIMTFINHSDTDIVYKRINKNIKEIRFYKGGVKIINPYMFEMFPYINIVIFKANPQTNFNDFVNILKKSCKNYKFVT